MANNVQFEDYTIKCKSAIKDAAIAGLEEAAGELESAVKRNTRVDTGQTKNSWRHIVDDDTLTGTVGNELENSLWEEFGKKSRAELKSGKIGIKERLNFKKSYYLRRLYEERKRTISKYARGFDGQAVQYACGVEFFA